MMATLADLWPYFAAALNVVVNLGASGHAVLYKRDTRAAIGWVGIIWLVPFAAGALLYVLLGINRIKRRAQSLRTEQPQPELPAVSTCPQALLDATLGPEQGHLMGLVRLVEDVTDRPLLHGNRVTPLQNGDEAYPVMLEAIGSARRSVNLCTYIFDDDRAGAAFVAALAEAVERGVEVRVLVDDVGNLYSWHSVVPRLLKRSVRAAKFLPTLVPWRFRYSNLRNHRKILVVDGEIGFTGGMNLREGNLLRLNPRRPIQDLHFRIEGPAVAHIQESFAVDWVFVTGELLEGERWFPPVAPQGPVLARGISDGPDEDLDKLRWVLLGAVSSARSSVIVVNPYFLPDAALIAALNVAALRGVEVTLLLPEKGNLALVHWASTALWWQLLEHGCRIRLSPPPFDHTKLVLIDGVWSFVGSANWDARSLRLNFELNIECYDRDLCGQLTNLVTARLARARPVSLQELNKRSLPVKLRDGIARLFSPYL